MSLGVSQGPRSWEPQTPLLEFSFGLNRMGLSLAPSLTFRATFIYAQSASACLVFFWKQVLVRRKSVRDNWVGRGYVEGEG